MSELIGTVVLAAVFLAVSAPSFVAVYRWWFGGGKLLNDRLSDLPASASRARRQMPERAGQHRGPT
jgi:hypothetical protein